MGTSKTHPIEIPLVAPHLTGREQGYVLEAINSGKREGEAAFTVRCERLLETALHVPRVFLTSSCTSALHLAGQAAGLGPGDEIIVPSFGFASCASVFASLGARVVFADSRPDTFNIDERRVAKLFGPRTRALLIIHYAGIGCDMDALVELASRAGVTLIEDCAHGLFGAYRGRPLGSMGALAALSFDSAKNVTCGEGGALIVNEARLINPVEVAFQRGTNRAELLRGESSHYEWLGPGGNYSMSELQAAFLLAQLEGWQDVQDRRRLVWTRYMEALHDWSVARGVVLPYRPPECEPAFHLFPVLLPSRSARDLVASHLGARGIASAPHYSPLHLSPGAKKYGSSSHACPCAESLSTRLLRLPLHAELTDGDVDRITAALLELNEAFAVTGVPGAPWRDAV